MHTYTDKLFYSWSQVISAFLINEVILNAANNDELDEKAKVPVVQQKGRFKVTSENVDLEKVCLIIPALLFVFMWRLDN